MCPWRDFALIVHQGRICDCYREHAGPLWLHGLDAVYVALGALTTAGSGEIVGHSRVCRGLTVGNCRRIRATRIDRGRSLYAPVRRPLMAPGSLT
jgi:hypothetical protein